MLLVALLAAFVIGVGLVMGLYTGVTKVPEMLAHHAGEGELVAHDCALHGNPSHSGIEDLEREYPQALLERCLLYHYGNREEGEILAARGYRVAHPGQVVALREPTAMQAEPA